VNPRRAAALSISIDVQDKTTIVIRDQNGHEQVNVTTDFSRTNLTEMHLSLRDDLDRFRKTLARVEQPSIRRVVDAMLRLQARGRSIVLDLFKGATEARRKTLNLCRDACPFWNVPAYDPAARPPSLIIVRTSLGSGIPVEMLPLVEWRTPVNCENDLPRVAASFLGFSAIVKRQAGGLIPGENLRLENDPKLPIRMFISRDLGGAIGDDDYLRKNPYVEVEAAWPSDKRLDTSEFCAVLARHLWRCDRTIGGHIRKPPIQICHLSCHCDTTKPYSGKFTLSFSVGPLRGKCEVTIEALRDALNALHDEEDVVAWKPLVFVNACGSAGLYPAGASSFPDLFLRNDFGFIGFVGTEATVPDGFATLFTRTFYDHLLEARQLGEAMHLTRWEILESKRNPLGLIYSLYAEPEIQVMAQRPRQREPHPRP
jgi:hypothetical protein